jgi:Acetyltransferase (GNAT) domain
MLVSDVICPEDDARRVLVPALAEYLRREPDGGRLAVLGPLPAGSALWDGLRRLAPLDYCLQSAEPCDVFDCARPFDELMARLSKHFRRNLRAHRKKLASFADVRFATATGDGLEAAFETFIAVEASGWKGVSGVGSAIALHPRLLAFYRRLAANTRDRCEIHLLAAQFCVVSGEQYSILKIGYDEAYARIGPGLLLLETTLERCCADPAIKRMSLVTDGAWQRDWRPDVVAMRRVYLGLGRWSGRPLVALLDLRFGPARTLVARVRERRAAAAGRRETRRPGAVKGDS